MTERPRLRALAAGTGFLAGLGLLYLLAVRTLPGQAADAALFGWAVGLLGVPGVEQLASLARAGTPVALTAVCIVLAGAAVVQRRWRALAASALIVGLSLALSRLLRVVLLDRPYLGEEFAYLENTFPSGHVAVALALAVAAALLAPRGIRLVVLGGAAALAVLSAPASVISHGHRPSDIAGSYLLVAAVTCFVGALTAPRTGVPGLTRLLELGGVGRS